MGQQEADEIAHELLDVLNDAAGTHAMATMGIIRVREWALSIEVENRTSESSVFIGHGDPNRDEGFAYQRWHLDTLPDRLDADGPIVRELGQQWLVLVASHWNDHYRHRIARALGLAVNDVTDPVMADINRMRNDVVHHRGIATARNAGRCEVLRWFSPHETIHPMAAHIAEFMHHMGLVVRPRDVDGGHWEKRDSM